MATAVAAIALVADRGAATTPGGEMITLAVPIQEQRPERCGPAALAMVLSFHGASPSQVALADSAYDPRLRGALITDLAVWARRAGFEARVARLGEDSLRTFLRQGEPPVLLYSRGFGPVTRQHYGVLVGWDEKQQVWTVHDGGKAPRRMSRRDLVARWGAAGSEALLVRPLSP